MNKLENIPMMRYRDVFGSSFPGQFTDVFSVRYFTAARVLVGHNSAHITE
jgi:hypothetical protein